MKVGTADIIEHLDEAKRRPSGRLGGTGSGSGGRRNPGGGGGGGGGDRPDNDQPPNSNRFIPNQSRILTGFLLLVVMMTFGGLMAAYVVIATNRGLEWRPFDLPIQVWISTLLIILSSIAYHFAKTSTDRNNQPTAKKWLLLTTVLGAAFISSQISAWLALTGAGYHVRGNPYAGFFYILTAVHAVHVLGGISALGAVLLRSWRPTEQLGEVERRRGMAQVVGWYWHFMGLLWIVLFGLLGFWK